MAHRPSCSPPASTTPTPSPPDPGGRGPRLILIRVVRTRWVATRACIPSQVTTGRRDKPSPGGATQPAPLHHVLGVHVIGGEVRVAGKAAARRTKR